SSRSGLKAVALSSPRMTFSTVPYILWKHDIGEVIHAPSKAYNLIRFPCYLNTWEVFSPVNLMDQHGEAYIVTGIRINLLHTLARFRINNLGGMAENAQLHIPSSAAVRL